MKSLGLGAFALTLVVAFAAHGGGDAAKKKELAVLEGVWKITAFETPEGKNADLEGATLAFNKDGKTVLFTHNGQEKKGEFKFNPAGKPKEIDISPEDENKTFEGIYRIEKNKMTLCLDPGSGDGRPNEFAVKEGKKYVLITLEKGK